MAFTVIIIQNTEQSCTKLGHRKSSEASLLTLMLLYLKCKCYIFETIGDKAMA